MKLDIAPITTLDESSYNFNGQTSTVTSMISDSNIVFSLAKYTLDTDDFIRSVFFRAAGQAETLPDSVVTYSDDIQVHIYNCIKASFTAPALPSPGGTLSMFEYTVPSSEARYTIK